MMPTFSQVEEATGMTFYDMLEYIQKHPHLRVGTGKFRGASFYPDVSIYYSKSGKQYECIIHKKEKDRSYYVTRFYENAAACELCLVLEELIPIKHLSWTLYK